MKMTMHINEELLDRAVEKFGCTSKTEAVDPDYDVMSMRAAESPNPSKKSHGR